MNYGIWLSFNNQAEGFKLPINPAGIEVGDGNKGETYDIEELGEINVIKNPQLTTYAFEGLFPAQEYPFASAPLLSPIQANGVKFNRYVYYLTKWMQSRRPIRFVCVGEGFEINTPASIESFTWQDVAGGGGDIQYSLKLKQYVFYSARKINLVPSASGEPAFIKDTPARANDKQPPKTYTLIKGDTLWKVAQTQLGSGTRWMDIQRLNGISDAELKRLPVGKVLKLQ